MIVVEFKNVTKTFQGGKDEIVALKPTTMQVKAGQFIAVIGPSGSGKSAFLTFAGGLQSPTSGQIFINGREFTNLSEKERSKQRFQDIGFVL